MSHPLYQLHLINELVESIRVDLTDKNDKKAQVLSTVKKMQKNIVTMRESFNQLENEKKWEQLGYFELVKIDFHIRNLDNELIGIHQREYKDFSLNMKMIKDIVNAERILQNQNENLLSARITLEDIDANMDDGEV